MAATDYASRIVDFDPEYPSDQLLANPLNARIHSRVQQGTLHDILDNIGFIAPVIVNRLTGHLIDGHARVMLALRNGSPVPVAFVELSDEEERVALATFDPVGDLAGYDAGLLNRLMEGVDSRSELIDAMLRDLTETASFSDIVPDPTSMDPSDGDAARQNPVQSSLVAVVFAGERFLVEHDEIELAKDLHPNLAGWLADMLGLPSLRRADK